MFSFALKIKTKLSIPQRPTGLVPPALPPPTSFPPSLFVTGVSLHLECCPPILLPDLPSQSRCRQETFVFVDIPLPSMPFPVLLTCSRLYCFDYAGLHCCPNAFVSSCSERGYSSLQCVGLSLRWLLLLRSAGSRLTGSAVGGCQASLLCCM